MRKKKKKKNMKINFIYLVIYLNLCYIYYRKIDINRNFLILIKIIILNEKLL